MTSPLLLPLHQTTGCLSIIVPAYSDPQQVTGLLEARFHLLPDPDLHLHEAEASSK